MTLEYDPKEGKEKLPFEGLKVYYSGSIKGAPEIDPDFAWNLVQYMVENGANVLSEHVAGRTKTEMEEIRARKMGVDVQTLLDMPRSIYVKDVVRKKDIEWVDEATHMVALVNAPSHGVGMELQHAILKPRMGMNKTPILCLVHEELLGKMSGMITGVSEEHDHAELYVRTYKTLQDAKETVFTFLAGRLQ